MHLATWGSDWWAAVQRGFNSLFYMGIWKHWGLSFGCLFFLLLLLLFLRKPVLVSGQEHLLFIGPSNSCLARLKLSTHDFWVYQRLEFTPGGEDTQTQKLHSYHWQCKNLQKVNRVSGRIINQSASSSHVDLQMFHKLAKNSEIQSNHIMRLTNMCECSKEKNIPVLLLQ